MYKFLNNPRCLFFFKIRFIYYLKNKAIRIIVKRELDDPTFQDYEQLNFLYEESKRPNIKFLQEDTNMIPIITGLYI